MSNDPEWSKVEQGVADVLGDWLYPNAQFCGGGQADDLKFIHAQFDSADSLEQVREFYWKKCEWDHDRTVGSCYDIDKYPKRFFRDGPPMLVAYATEQQTMSVVVVPSEDHGAVGLFFTLEVH
jgi:hypothetical protein